MYLSQKTGNKAIVCYSHVVSLLGLITHSRISVTYSVKQNHKQKQIIKKGSVPWVVSQVFSVISTVKSLTHMNNFFA